MEVDGILIEPTNAARRGSLSKLPPRGTSVDTVKRIDVVLEKMKRPRV